jgi:hypothetical protein
MATNRLPIYDAALMLATGVPGAISEAGRFHALRPDSYARLSTTEKAAHDLAYELWLGNGPLSRYILNADGNYARRLISAITVALGPITLDLAD